MAVVAAPPRAWLARAPETGNGIGIAGGGSASRDAVPLGSAAGNGGQSAETLSSAGAAGSGARGAVVDLDSRGFEGASEQQFAPQDEEGSTESTLQSMGCSELRCRHRTVPAIDYSPLTPLQANCAGWWSVEHGVTTQTNAIDCRFPTDFSQWTRFGIGTVTSHQPMPFGRGESTTLMQDSSVGPHEIDMGWTGTISDSSSVVIEVTARAIGDTHLWFRDAWDNEPIWHAHGASIVAVAGVNATATAVSLGNGWYRYVMSSRGLLHTVDPNYMVSIAMGDESGFLQVPGDPTRGMSLASVKVYQRPVIAEVTNQLPAGVPLKGDSTYPPEYRRDGAAFRVEAWVPVGSSGFLQSTDPELLNLYAPGRPHTTLFTLAVYQQPPAARTLFLTRDDGMSFSVGIEPDLRLWVGIYGISYYTTLDALEAGRKYAIAIVHDGMRSRLFVDGELYAMVPTLATDNPNRVWFNVSDDEGISQMAVFERELGESEVRRVSRAMLGLGCKPPTSFATPNTSLWETSIQKRLGLSESHFQLDGTAKSVTVEAWSLYGSSTAQAYGPSVFADGKRLGTMRVPQAPGPHRQTFALTPGARRLIVRNGPALDNPTGTFVQSYATRVNVEGAALLKPQRPAHRVVVFGDSIANGFNATIPGVEAWPMILRDEFQRERRVTLFGSGGYALASDAMYTEPWATIGTRLAMLLDGTASNVLVMAIGINDAMGYSEIWGESQAFGSALADLVDRVHAAVPSATIVMNGFHRCVNALGSSEERVDLYRQEVLAVARTRAPWCVANDESRLVVAMDDTDYTHLHPNTAGQRTLGFSMATELRALTCRQP